MDTQALWAAATKTFTSISQKAGEAWEAVANVVAPESPGTSKGGQVSCGAH
jgi:hypothetical protein